MLKSGFTTRDTAKLNIAGTAETHIGEDDADYTSDNRKFWSKNLTGPKIDIGGTAIIEMEGSGDGNSGSDTPVLSMRGRCLVDMCGSLDLSNAPIGYNRSRTANWFSSPFGYNDYDPFNSTQRLTNSTVAFPYLHMHDTSSIVMDGAPILKMAGNSCVNVDGDVCINIQGENSINRNWFGGSGGIGIDLRPGAFIQVGAGGSSTPSTPKTSIVRITENQMLIDCANPRLCDLSSGATSGQLYTSDGGNGYGYPNARDGYFPFRGDGLSILNNDSSYVKPFIFGPAIRKWKNDDNNTIYGWGHQGYWADDTSHSQGPTFMMQGKSRVIIGDGGTTAMMIGGTGNTSIKIMPYGGASFELSLGSSGGADVINIANGSSSFMTFNHSSASGSSQRYDFTPNGSTMFKFGP